MTARIFFLLLMIPFLVGYRVYPKGDTWNITRTDRYLFLDFCQGFSITENDVESDDPMYIMGQSLTSDQLINSVVTDYNSVTSQYVQLGLTTDLNYNPTTHSERIIDVCQGDQTGTAGYAQQKTDGEGKIIGCTITLGRFSGKAKELIQVLTHELGHCLGLDHPQETKHAIMSYFSDPDKIYRLQPDDKAGLTYLYPMDTDYERKMTLGASCSPQ